MHQWASIWKNTGANLEVQGVTASLSEDTTSNVQVAGFLPVAKAEVNINYTVHSDGAVLVEYEFIPENVDLPVIPRIGLQMKLPGEYNVFSWYGRGPHETYWDRKHSGKVGIYKGSVWDQIHPYSRPQETGNKTDIRWMSLQNNQGTGIKVTAVNSFLSGSAWPFTAEQLEFVAGAKGAESASGLVPVSSKHGAELFDEGIITWNIDYLQMGVGGDTSWGRPVHEEYTIPVQEYKYQFWMVPFGPGD
jgi:beta-galactosidase